MIAAMRPDDLTLVRDAQRGNAAARDELVGRYFPVVERIANRVMGADHPRRDDAVQEALIRMLDQIERYDEAKGIPVEAYLCKAIKCDLLDELRKRNRYRQFAEDDDGRSLESLVTDSVDGFGELVHALDGEEATEIQNALSALSDIHKAVLKMRTEGYTDAQTARLLKVSRRTVGIILHEAMRSISD
jgi:RNA polymerase sigma factor (sigma-70 family)